MSFDHGTEDNQESFVTVQFNHISTGAKGTVLFGSSIKHNHLVSLTVRKGSVRRNLNQDWVHGSDEMIEVWLSPSQFAELLTTMNYGSGVPGTLKHVKGVRVEDPVLESKHLQFTKELSKDIEETLTHFDRILKRADSLLASSKPLTRAEKDELQEGIQKVQRLMTDHLPFLVKQFTQQMDKTASEAKAEVEAFIDHAVSSAGLQALKEKVEQTILLEEPKQEEK